MFIGEGEMSRVYVVDNYMVKFSKTYQLQLQLDINRYRCWVDLDVKYLFDQRNQQSYSDITKLIESTNPCIIDQYPYIKILPSVRHSYQCIEIKPKNSSIFQFICRNNTVNQSFYEQMQQYYLKKNKQFNLQYNPNSLLYPLYDYYQDGGYNNENIIQQLQYITSNNKYYQDKYEIGQEQSISALKQLFLGQHGQTIAIRSFITNLVNFYKYAEQNFAKINFDILKAQEIDLNNRYNISQQNELISTVINGIFTFTEIGQYCKFEKKVNHLICNLIPKNLESLTVLSVLKTLFDAEIVIYVDQNNTYEDYEIIDLEFKGGRVNKWEQICLYTLNQI